MTSRRKIPCATTLHFDDDECSEDFNFEMELWRGTSREQIDLGASAARRAAKFKPVYYIRAVETSFLHLFLLSSRRRTDGFGAN